MSTPDPDPHRPWGGGWGPPLGGAGGGLPNGGSSGLGPPPPGPPPGGSGPEPGSGPTCYVHPGRPASATCRRCGQPICTECMREAPVGWQCARCVHRDSRTTPVIRWQPRRRGTLGATRMTPLVMVAVAVNVAVFLVEETNLNSIVIRFGLWPAQTRHQPYRLLTAAFLHANFTHILLNMITLIIVGPAVEAAVGRTRFVVVYLLAAIGGNLLDYLIAPVNIVGVGASGAIFGLMGTYLVLARSRRWDTSVVGILIVVNLVFSFLDPGIDWQAHVGGLAVGALLGWVFALTERRSGPTVAIDSLACAVVFASLAVLSLLPPGQVAL